MKKINYYILLFLVVLPCFVGRSIEASGDLAKKALRRTSSTGDISLSSLPLKPLTSSKKTRYAGSTEEVMNYDTYLKELDERQKTKTTKKNEFVEKLNLIMTHLNVDQVINEFFINYDKASDELIEKMASLIPPIEIFDVYSGLIEKINIDQDVMKRYKKRVYSWFKNFIIKGDYYRKPDQKINQLTDYVAKENVEKLIFLTRMLLKIQLIKTIKDTPSGPADWLTGHFDYSYSRKERLNLAFDKFTKETNCAIYAAKKLYQKYRDKFDTEKNELGKIFDILPVEIKNLWRLSDYEFDNLKKMNPSEKFRNAFFNMVEEGKIKQFKRYNPKTFYMLMAGAGYGILEILALLYQKGYFPESMKNYIDKKLNPE